MQAGILDYAMAAASGHGTLLLLDRGSSRFALLDSTGRLLHTGGAKGRGPGEIGVAMGVTRVRGDSFAVLDRTNARLLLLDKEGRAGRMVSTITAASGGVAFLVGAMEPDSMVIAHQRYGMTRAEGLSADSMTLRLVSVADGGARLLTTRPAGRSFKRSATQRMVSIPVPADARTTVQAVAGRLFIAPGAAMQVDVMSPNGTRRPGLCLAYSSNRVTEALVAADRASDRPLGAMAQRLRTHADAAAGSRLAPAVRGFVALDDTTLAMHRWTPRSAGDNEYLLVRINGTGLAPYARLRLHGQQELLALVGGKFVLIDQSADESVLLFAKRPMS